ncbi:hypothetical protein PHYSODRAFT_304113 [Phytophthora sojae]|uniref:Uncharacterized protein n=1 Tax=Phytophthora sojae (strain P6497) TaxID=1094619 RepID=G4ZX24_PHYSP|nr:hypothetical protein PHYSODRAFT_304112 [Phytophthora sojae]XP_009532828.1 hypothetical protein PHYSODRAFT_304113 [Phytophthora sojae]EGZ12494.1 hypothetical protein PHYSODRAFT_304112 [Phytophthora sojae]EGZ12495.1 hypothetical protein PHYSODRAFT_304113 [Phytophthora sojae]|eukprot:XP_009532827.1 hypothetical protein PHYSODRAFT_304112 [Phytophthora sojae]
MATWWQRSERHAAPLGRPRKSPLAHAGHALNRRLIDRGGGHGNRQLVVAAPEEKAGVYRESSSAASIGRRPPRGQSDRPSGAALASMSGCHPEPQGLRRMQRRPPSSETRKRLPSC